MSVLQIVKGCPLFYELYDNEILKIVEKCRVLNLEPGELIFEQGDEGDEMFLILSGSANVIKEEIELARLRKGDLFGEMVLLKENIRKANVVADNFTSVLIVNYSDIFGLFEKNNQLFSILMLNLARMLATRLKKAGKSIEELKKNEHLKKAS